MKKNISTYPGSRIAIQQLRRFRADQYQFY